MEPTLIETDPQTDIFFKLIPGNNVTNIIQVRNITRKYVAYKIKTTNPKSYVVKPNQGLLSPGQKADIEFILQHKEINSDNANIMDKFMVIAIEAESNYDLNKLQETIMELTKQNKVQNIRIKANLFKEGSMINPNAANSNDNLINNNNTISNFQSPLRVPKNDLRMSVDNNVGPSSNISFVTSQKVGNTSSFAKSNAPGNSNVRISYASNDSNREYEKILAKIDDQMRELTKLQEEKNHFYVELTNLKESISNTNKVYNNKFQLWQVLLVAIISLIIGAFLSAP